MYILSNGIATCGPNEPVNDWIMERGLCYDQMVLPSIVPLLKPGDWVVDGGAAIGDHTIAYLNAVGVNGKVLAFEPSSTAFECLQHNCPQAIAIRGMLWFAQTELYLCLSSKSMGGSHFAFEPPSTEYEGPIGALTLDSLELERLNLLKLDIEGAEYFALCGAEKTIQRCRPIIVLEMNSSIAARSCYTSRDIYALLDKWNYRHYSISGDKSQHCSDCDIVALPK